MLKPIRNFSGKELSAHGILIGRLKDTKSNGAGLSYFLRYKSSFYIDGLKDFRWMGYNNCYAYSFEYMFTALKPYLDEDNLRICQIYETL